MSRSVSNARAAAAIVVYDTLADLARVATTEADVATLATLAAVGELLRREPPARVELVPAREELIGLGAGKGRGSD